MSQVDLIENRISGYLTNRDLAAWSGDKFRVATRDLALLWFAFQQLANGEQEDGTLVLCMQ